MELTNEQELMQRIINEAWVNETFKQELSDNPVEAIEKLTGEQVVLPEGKTLIVRDQTAEQTIYINVPVEKKLEDVELNEEQLEAVAGGMDLMHIWLPSDFPICTMPYPIRGNKPVPVFDQNALAGNL